LYCIDWKKPYSRGRDDGCLLVEVNKRCINILESDCASDNAKRDRPRCRGAPLAVGPNRRAPRPDANSRAKELSAETM
jgi:hypothetical protein